MAARTVSAASGAATRDASRASNVSDVKAGRRRKKRSDSQPDFGRLDVKLLADDIMQQNLIGFIEPAAGFSGNVQHQRGKQFQVRFV